MKIYYLTTDTMHLSTFAKALLRLQSVALIMGVLSAPAGAQVDINAPPIANVIVGGAERRCSSFTGESQSRDCTADWDTILREDPAFRHLAKRDISFAADYEFPQLTYSLTHTTMARLRTSPDRLFDAQRKAALLNHVNHQLATLGEQVSQEWRMLEPKVIRPSAQGEAALTLSELAIIRSALVDAPPSAPRKLQARSMRFSSNRDSVAIMQAMVSAARALNGGAKPLIGIVSASSGPHPFVDRDINVFALQSAGADAVYLPVDGGFRQALDHNDCANMRYYYDSYANLNPQRPVLHADLQFPDLALQQRAMCDNGGALLNTTLRQIHGLLFTGGNQARHLESFVSKDSAGNYTLLSEQWQIVQSRHAKGQLVIAGSSAGDHIQGGGLWRGRPVPMIGGGDSYDVLKNGYSQGHGPAGDTPGGELREAATVYVPAMYPLGGLGTFRFGVLDSHFSQRTREARLIRATHDSGMDYGFGVDENTALLVTQADIAGTTHFSVTGAGGVFIVDVREAVATRHPSPIFELRDARAHYLLPGDRARIDVQGNLTIELNHNSPVLTARADAESPIQRQLLDYGSGHFLKLATTMGMVGAHTGFGTTDGSKNKRMRQDQPFFSALLERDAQTQFRQASPLVDSPNTQPTRVSYTGLLVHFQPCSAQCASPNGGSAGEPGSRR